MQVVINLPDDYNVHCTPEQIIEELKLNNALMLYKQNKISITRAAGLAGIDIYNFIRECKKNKIPVINYTKEELKAEFEKLKREFL